MAKTDLRLDWATHEAAKFACERWHYSGCLPAGKLIKVGVWESGKYIGAIIFSRGASAHLLTKYSLAQTEGCELTRVALTKHKTPVSRILSIALKFLRQKAPSIQLIVSFSDPIEGHHGGIYQATNWIYSGVSNKTMENFTDGRWQHVRNSYHKTKGKKRPVRVRPGKHRYLMPLSASMRKRIEVFSKPYPKRTPVEDHQKPFDEGGATPTRSLQSSNG